MSATSRGRERLPDDTYFSPTWTVDRLFEKIKLPGGTWLEPGAGDGRIIATSSSLRGDIDWTAVEIQKPLIKKLHGHVPVDRVFRGDFLELVKSGHVGIAGPFDVAIGNPPYSLAQEFIEASLKLAKNVVFLLRLNFLESEERSTWMAQHVPDIYVLPNRPSYKVFVSDVYFCSHCDYGKEKSVPQGNAEPRCQGCGKAMAFKGEKKSSSDASAYAWMHWHQGVRTEGKVVMLNTTPKAQRKNKE